MIVQDLSLLFMFAFPLILAIWYYSTPGYRYKRFKILMGDIILLLILGAFWYWLIDMNYLLEFHYLIFPSLSITFDVIISAPALFLLTLFETGFLLMTFGTDLPYYPRSKQVSIAIFKTGLMGVLFNSNLLFFLLSLEVMVLSLHFAVFGHKKEEVKKSSAYLLFTQIAFVLLSFFYLLLASMSQTQVLLNLNTLIEAVKNSTIFLSSFFLFFGFFGWALLLPIFPLFAWIKDTILVSKSPLSYVTSGGMVSGIIYAFYRWYFLPFSTSITTSLQLIFISIFFISEIITALLIYKSITLKGKFLYIFFTELHIVLIGYVINTQEALCSAMVLLAIFPVVTILAFLFVWEIRTKLGTDTCIQLQGVLQKNSKWVFHVMLLTLIIGTVPFVPFFAELIIVVELLSFKMTFWLSYLFVFVLLAIAMGNLGVMLSCFSILNSKNMSAIVLENDNILSNQKRNLIGLLILIYLAFSIFVVLVILEIQNRGGFLL
ncbi:MAG: proton-conducting transporter transmembrane domain-containing protein [Candidatus Heimdallarchaeaceae archaeon]